MDYRAAKKIWPKDILDLNRNFCSKPAKYRTDTWKLQNFYNNPWFTICPYFLFFPQRSSLMPTSNYSLESSKFCNVIYTVHNSDGWMDTKITAYSFTCGNLKVGICRHEFMVICIIPMHVTSSKFWNLLLPTLHISEAAKNTEVTKALDDWRYSSLN